MAMAIKVPDIGTTVDHVKLVKWLKSEGDSVKRGEPLCEVETDKAVSELESIAEGVVLKQLFEEDAEIEQGTVIAYVGKAGEAVPDEASDAERPTTSSPKPSAKDASNTQHPTPKAAIAPLIRNLAKKEGVDLDTVTGTGPGGRITREDVLKAKSAAPLAGKPLSPNQQVVAKRVARSQQEIPPIHLTGRIDMSAVIADRERMKAEGTKVSFDAFFLRAVAGVMKAFPHFRSRLESGSVIESDDVVPGIAVSEGYELYTPVIRGADGLSLADLEASIRDLLEKAKRNAFTQQDLNGGTLTVSNLGMYPVQSFSAIIPPDQVAILSVGATELSPVVRDGKVEVVPMAAVTLSVNHRMINGREGAEFLAALKEKMENL